MSNKSTKPMDVCNDVACFVTQARGVIDMVIEFDEANDRAQAQTTNALYGARSLLDSAFERLTQAKEERP